MTGHDIGHLSSATAKQFPKQSFGARLALASVTALGLAVAMPLAVHAQTPSKDVLYDTHTAPSGGCPGMDWHVMVHPDRTMNGVVSWDGDKHMAHMNGTMDKDGAFKVNAVEKATGKSHTVTGQVEGNDLKASISGTGTACDNQTMNVPRDTKGMSTKG